MRSTVTLFLAFLFLLFATSASATMLPFQTFSGEGAGLSVDAVGMQTDTEATVSADIPANAQIEAAYLYSASVWDNSLSDVTFDGTTLTSDASSRLDVGAKQANPASENRWDVTDNVNAKYDNTGGTYDFDVTELGYLDGEVLSVIYSVPTQEVRTTLLYDGELATGGDSFSVSLSEPYDGTSNALMSLGISYGYQGSNQYTQVDINGERLTTSAGGQDDGYGSNGGLITAGGIGDDFSNPDNPFATPTGPESDDEYYNLASFLDTGDTGFTIDTVNPSDNDNVFFMGLNVKGEAIADNGPAPVPEPSTMLLLGTGLLGLGVYSRKKLLNRQS